MAYDGPGQYQHYKGPLYYALGLAADESHKVEAIRDMDPRYLLVIYRPLTLGGMLENNAVIGMWARSLEDFNATVVIDGNTPVSRFRKVTE